MPTVPDRDVSRQSRNKTMACFIHIKMALILLQRSNYSEVKIIVWRRIHSFMQSWRRYYWHIVEYASQGNSDGIQTSRLPSALLSLSGDNYEVRMREEKGTEWEHYEYISQKISLVSPEDNGLPNILPRSLLGR